MSDTRTEEGPPRLHAPPGERSHSQDELLHAQGECLEAPSRCDLAVVGGGIVGLAVARELLARHSRMRLCVLEREPQIGAHQTGHNSGVIHAGVYYAPGSLKAKLCVEGARETYAYCEQRSIPYERCGKLIVATEPGELGRLEELQSRAIANGVSGIRRIGPQEIAELERHTTGIAAIHSPATGITDFGAVARAYAQDVIEAGGTIHTGCSVQGAQANARYLSLRHSAGLTEGLGSSLRHSAGLTEGLGSSPRHSAGVTEARHAVFCAGAWSDRLARACGAGPDPRIVPFRGAYLRLRPERRHLVSTLVYPVPDPALPFLGVHLTKTIDGEVLIGPTALLAPARDAYSLGRLRGRDLLDTLAWPGSWRMFARWWRTGLTEATHAASRAAFVRAAARYVPELRVDDVQPAFAGIRAQALARDGRLVDDFVFSATDRALHVRNAPSPAATSAPAIARHIADQVQSAFDLGR